MKQGVYNARLAPRGYGVHLGIGHVALAAPAGIRAAGSLKFRPPMPRVRSSIKTACTFVRAFRRAISLVMLSVALTYFFLVLVGAGILRPELIDDLRLGAWTSVLAGPAQLQGTRIFVVPTIYRSVDMLLLACGIMMLAARSMISRALERLEASFSPAASDATRRAKT